MNFGMKVMGPNGHLLNVKVSKTGRKYVEYMNKKTGRKTKKYINRQSTKSPVRKRKSPARKRKSPARKRVNYAKKVVVSPKHKTVRTNKGKKVGKRLSARGVYNEHGKTVVGKKFNILQKNGEYAVKVLRIRQNGSPYFANKFGNKTTFPLIPPYGIAQPAKMTLLPHSHFGKMCFG